MTSDLSFDITLENPCDSADIDALHESVFGPGRFVRTAFRVREGCKPDPRFCFVAFDQEQLVGSVRFTEIMINEARAYLLGPLGVLEPMQGVGIGRKLVCHGTNAVMKQTGLPVILVGDAAYYAPFGFEKAPSLIKMPGPVDYERLLIAWPDRVIDQSTYRGLMRGLSSFSIPHEGESTQK